MNLLIILVNGEFAGMLAFWENTDLLCAVKCFKFSYGISDFSYEDKIIQIKFLNSTGFHKFSHQKFFQINITPKTKSH